MQKSSANPRRPVKENGDILAARTAIRESIEVNQRVAAECLGGVVEMARIIANALRKGRKVVFFGNGGSAADAQHIVAELVGQFKTLRPPLDAIALTTNTSILTAIGNDFSFDEIFSRQVRANLSEGDVAVGISTSGRSKNVILGVQEARRLGAKTIALAGGDGGQLAPLCDLKVIVPSSDTQRIQECHIMIGHIVCELVDEALGSGPEIGSRQVKRNRSARDANS
jgi:D-sedoheptulose 7-phosphate isomerase